MVPALNLRNPRVSPASVRLTGKSVRGKFREIVDFDLKSELRGDISAVPPAKQLGAEVWWLGR